MSREAEWAVARAETCFHQERRELGRRVASVRFRERVARIRRVDRLRGEVTA